MKYKIMNSSGHISKMEIKYACSHCGTALRNPLDEAGTNDSCPECGMGFEVPGKSEYEDLLNKQQDSDMARKLKMKEQTRNAQKDAEQSRKMQEQRAVELARQAEEARKIADQKEYQMLDTGPVVKPAHLMICFILFIVGMLLFQYVLQDSGGNYSNDDQYYGVFNNEYAPGATANAAQDAANAAIVASRAMQDLVRINTQMMNILFWSVVWTCGILLHCAVYIPAKTVSLQRKYT